MNFVPQRWPKIRSCTSIILRMGNFDKRSTTSESTRARKVPIMDSILRKLSGEKVYEGSRGNSDTIKVCRSCRSEGIGSMKELKKKKDITVITIEMPRRALL